MGLMPGKNNNKSENMTIMLLILYVHILPVVHFLNVSNILNIF